MKNKQNVKYFLAIAVASVICFFGVQQFATNIQSVWAGNTDVIAIQESASVRVVQDSSGIRFQGEINKAYLEQLENKSDVSKVTYGILITPRYYLDQVSEFTIDALSAKYAQDPYLKIPAEHIIDNGDVYEFRCAMTDLTVNAYEWEFAARSYIEVVYENGTIEYIYSDFAEGANVRSIKNVAKAALEESGNNYTEEETLLLKNYIREDVLDEVYVSSINGNDKNYGTEEAPYATLSQALDSVANNGVIVICDSHIVSPAFEWKDSAKTITITGDADTNVETLSFAFKTGNVELGNHVTFDNLKLVFAKNANVFANGHTLVIAEGVTIDSPINLYGGGNNTTVESTNITVLSGNYDKIYGGGNDGLVLGNTNVVVGGNVNSNINVADHSLTNKVYGGSYNSVVGGNTNVTIQDSAQTSVVYGGGVGGASKVNGTCFVNVNGGNVMGYYGGSDEGVVYNTVLKMTAGTTEQIFGGCYGISMKGNATVTITGGTITRRIYGGCYNETSGLTYDTEYFVTGNTTVSIGGTTNYTHSGSAETAISAGSRHSTNHDKEVATLKIETETLYNKLENYIGCSLLKVSGYDDLYVAGVKK